MRSRQNGSHPHDEERNGAVTESSAESFDVVGETEAIRTMLHHALARLGHLLGALKQQKRQSRAVSAAMKSLRHLQLDR